MPISRYSFDNIDSIDENVNKVLCCDKCIFNCSGTSTLINLVEVHINSLDQCACFKKMT